MRVHVLMLLYMVNWLVWNMLIPMDVHGMNGHVGGLLHMAICPVCNMPILMDVLKALDLIGREDSNLKVARDIHNARVAQAE